MAKGLALTIGLNAVDPRHYAGWSGRFTRARPTPTTWPTSRRRKFTVQTLS